MNNCNNCILRVVTTMKESKNSRVMNFMLSAVDLPQLQRSGKLRVEISGVWSMDALDALHP